MKARATHPLLARASRLRRKGQFADAETACSEFLRRFPGNADALCLLGLLKSQRGCLSSARTLFGEALAINPGLVEARLAMAELLFKALEFAEAEREFLEVIEAQPRSARAACGVGKCRLVAGDMKAAIRYFQESVAFDPNADAFLGLAQAFLAMGDRRAAVAMAVRCDQLEPDDPRVCSALAVVFEGLSMDAEAERLLETAINLDPLFAEAHWRLGDVLRKRGLVELALRHYESAVAQEPGNRFAQARYAHALLNSGSSRKLGVLKRLRESKLYSDPGESASLAAELAGCFGYENPDAEEALETFLNGFDPGGLHDSQWWRTQVERFGGEINGHDRLMRCVMSSVYSWSIPAAERSSPKSAVKFPS